jgi:hypothetical protein
MGILQAYPVKEFYKTIDPKAYAPGQICFTVVPHLTKIPQILDVERRNPEEHDYIKFILRNAKPTGDFVAADRTLPLSKINLRTKEELVVHRAKKRPCIIMPSIINLYPEITTLLRGGKEHLQDDALFVIPCYGIETREDPSGFPPEMAERIRCLIYSQFFPIPAHKIITKNSVARFDRIQVIRDKKERAAIETSELCLSDEVFNIFFALFLYCCAGIVDDDLTALRQLTVEKYLEI